MGEMRDVIQPRLVELGRGRVIGNDADDGGHMPGTDAPEMEIGDAVSAADPVGYRMWTVTAQMSIFSAIAMASSISMPRYRTVLSIFECPSKCFRLRGQRVSMRSNPAVWLRHTPTNRLQMQRPRHRSPRKATSASLKDCLPGRIRMNEWLMRFTQSWWTSPVLGGTAGAQPGKGADIQTALRRTRTRGEQGRKKNRQRQNDDGAEGQASGHEQTEKFH